MAGDQSTDGPLIAGPDADGRYAVTFGGPGFASLFGVITAWPEGERRSRVRTMPDVAASNINGVVHGGYTLGFLDQAIFVGPAVLGLVSPGKAVTLSVSTQFVGAGAIGVPLDCVVDVVRQTRQLLFVAGVVEQPEGPIVSFQACLRTFESRMAPA